MDAWLLSQMTGVGCFGFSSMLIYACATVAGDKTMQGRCCRNTSKGEVTTQCNGATAERRQGQKKVRVCKHLFYA
jgi:hypothetical protein